MLFLLFCGYFYSLVEKKISESKLDLFCLQGKVKDVELKGHTDSVDQLCWDPKHSELIATASGDKTVRLWDARSKRLFNCVHVFDYYYEKVHKTAV